MTNQAFLCLFALLLCLVCSSGVEAQARQARPTASRPNIVIILADDLGFSDLGCYGSEIDTPNLDAQAVQGLRFTQFYNAARCCPSRASLLTGLYPHQAGIGHMVDAWASRMREQLNSPAYTDHLNNRSVTIAEVLRQAGYHTYLSGKWHVGDARPYWPVERGFMRSFALIAGALNYFDPAIGPQFGTGLVLDDQPYVVKDRSFYLTDALTDYACRFLSEHDRDAPFFLYLAYTAPHWPLHAPAELIAKYRGRYRVGWDELRQRRYARLIELGLIDRRWPLTPRDERVPAWSDAARQQAWPPAFLYTRRNDELPRWDIATDLEMWDLKMAVYAAQVERMDQGIGRVLAKLKEIGAEQNTLVLFLSDNGGAAEPIDRGQPGKPPGAVESYLSYGIPWANVSNTPFRLHKSTVHEGGIATPLIATWPAVIRSGQITHQIGHIIDIMATIVDVARARYPRTYRGQRIQPLEGQSLLPIFYGQQRQRVLFWEHEGNRAVRQGKWKLVARHLGEWELYDLEVDRTELKNLASKYPAKVEELTALYQAWAQRVGVQPWPRRVITPIRSTLKTKRRAVERRTY